MTDWCRSTWLSTEPSTYRFSPPLLTAASTASLMAQPRLPEVSGSAARMARPASVVMEGEGVMVASNTRMTFLRKGFCS